MKALVSLLLIAGSIPTVAQAQYANVTGTYVCTGAACLVGDEPTITIEGGLFPIVVCDSMTAGRSVGVFTSRNSFTCYGSAVAYSDGVYFQFNGMHWKRPTSTYIARHKHK